MIRCTDLNYKSKTLLINESGLYSFILSSKLPSVKTVFNSSGLKIVNWCYSEYVLVETAKKIESRCHSTFAESKTLGEFFKISFDDTKNKLSRHLNIAETMYID